MMVPRRNRRGDAGSRAPRDDGNGPGPASERPFDAAMGAADAARRPSASPASATDPNTTAALPALPLPGSPEAADPCLPAGLADAQALADMQAFNDLKARRKKQKRKKIIVGAVSAVAVLAVMGGAFAWYSADQAAKALQDSAPQTDFVEQGTFVETVSASGSLRPVASVSATPEVEGIVGEVFVAEGDAVTEGQTLFTVVNDELDKAVNQAAQGIQEAENGVAQAQIAVNDTYHAKSVGEQAAFEAQAQALEVAGAPAVQTSFDEGSADSAIRSAELALSSANLALQNAQSAYDEAVARAAKRTVTASISGSVVAVNIEPGKALGAASGASASPVQIADLSQMTVSINVSEIDILKVSPDQTAEVTFTAAPDLVLPATVVSIATTSASSGDESGGTMYGAVTYAVKLLIAEPDPRLKPGMTAKASITTTTVENALMVPISAVQNDGAGGSFVLVVTDPESYETAVRDVEVVASDGLTSVVKGQVKAGDEVVVDGSAGSGADAVDASMGAAGTGAVMAG